MISWRRMSWRWKICTTGSRKREKMWERERKFSSSLERCFNGCGGGENEHEEAGETSGRDNSAFLQWKTISRRALTFNALLITQTSSLMKTYKGNRGLKCGWVGRSLRWPQILEFSQSCLPRWKLLKLQVDPNTFSSRHMASLHPKTTVHGSSKLFSVKEAQRGNQHLVTWRSQRVAARIYDELIFKERKFDLQMRASAPQF